MKMLRKALFLLLPIVCLCGVNSQPVSCEEDAQCGESYYCDAQVHTCKECLSCKDLKRESPLTSTDCITSVAQCGDCFKGLVVDRLGDVNSACVVASSEESTGSAHYAWWLGGFLVAVILVLVAVMIAYIYMNPEILKLGGNCQGGTVSTNIITEARPSAPEAPPPYSAAQYNNIPYNPVRTESPCPPHPYTERVNGVYVDEEEGPFIKRSVPSRPAGAREAAGNQAANVYNLPIYERQDLGSPGDTPIVTEINDNLDIHNEETMESPWTPNGPNNGDINANVSEPSAVSNGAAGDSMAAMLATARETNIIEHTPPKQLCIRPPSSNRNRDGNPGGDGNQGNFSGSQNMPPYNFITQINNVVQFNRTT